MVVTETQSLVRQHLVPYPSPTRMMLILLGVDCIGEDGEEEQIGVERKRGMLEVYWQRSPSLRWAHSLSNISCRHCYRTHRGKLERSNDI